MLHEMLLLGYWFEPNTSLLTWTGYTFNWLKNMV
jgi:hypothetical protein